MWETPKPSEAQDLKIHRISEAYVGGIQFGWKSLNGPNCIVLMVVGFRVCESFAECVPNKEILFCKLIEMRSKLLPPVAKDKIYKASF